MKAVLIYDSLYGNTEKIAHAIADGLSGAMGVSGSVEVAKVSDAHPDQLAGLPLLLIGGPTHGCRPSPAMHDFLDRIPQNALAGVQVAAFDTRTDPDQLTGATRVFAKILDRFGYAAAKISSSLENKGGQVVKLPEGFIVLGTEGPLQDSELERAADWGRQIVSRRGDA
jgi:flavodoxin I